MYRIIPAGVFVCLLVVQACSDCGGNTVKEIKEIKGDALTFEAITLGVDPPTFQKKAANLVGIESADAENQVVCRDQLELSVPDLDENVVEVRSRGTRILKNCQVKSNALKGQLPIKEIRGEFIDNKLVRLSFRFGSKAYPRVVQQLKQRFGEGSDVVFKEQTLLDELPEPYLAWKRANLVWLLAKSGGGTALLVHQDLQASQVLKEPPKTPKRGKPVSLEDIGIGKLDLNAPLPDIDHPDAG